jgi:hypothetical protein
LLEIEVEVDSVDRGLQVSAHVGEQQSLGCLDAVVVRRGEHGEIGTGPSKTHRPNSSISHCIDKLGPLDREVLRRTPSLMSSDTVRRYPRNILDETPDH